MSSAPVRSWKDRNAKSKSAFVFLYGFQQLEMITTSTISFQWALILCFSFVLVLVACLPYVLRLHQQRLRQRLTKYYNLPRESKLVAFFHPYCNAGGGGERVLWTAVQSLLRSSEPQLLIVYTNDPVSLHHRSRCFENVKRIFGLHLELEGNLHTNVHFVPLRTVFLLTARLYPVLTLAGQALGSLFVGLEALCRCPPDVFIDTTGCAFTLPMAKRIAQCQTAAYVHYPTVSSSMLDRVSSAVKPNASGCISLTYNNASWIRNSTLISTLKLWYYHLLVFAYKWAGSASNVDLAMCNSTWTRNHIRSLWGGHPYTLYPPCPTPPEASIDDGSRKPWIMSIGQFRPEKNHELQLEAFQLFLKRMAQSGNSTDFRLMLVGGARDSMDEALVRRLRSLCRTLNIEQNVEFHVNVNYAKLQTLFKKCMVNLHTMVEEHFGIGVVEGMASGLITVAHGSGGPQSDIIGPSRCTVPESPHQEFNVHTGVGFLATTAEEYADVFELVLVQMTSADRAAIRQNAWRRSCDLFSEHSFSVGWMKCFQTLAL